jgi:hypothetical protein
MAGMHDGDCACAQADVSELPDEIARNGEEFSDGVGVITSAGMARVVQALPLDQHWLLRGALPAAVQVRMHGCVVQGVAAGAIRQGRRHSGPCSRPLR